LTSDLSHDEQLEFARQIALRLLDSRSRSEAELWDRLTSRGVPDEICQELIGRFRDVGLVDDAAFADALTQTCVQVNRYGATRIRAELRRRGVAEDVVAEALGQVGYEEELEAALAFARRRSHRRAGLDPQVARRRLTAALARRGFQVAVVSSAVDDVLGEAAPDTDDNTLVK